MLAALLDSAAGGAEPAWEPAGLPIGERPAVYVAAVAGDGTRLVGVRPDGVFRAPASSGRADWRRTFEPFRPGVGPNTESIAFAPSRPSVAYLGLERLGVRRSDDGGQTWVRRNRTLPKGRARNVVSVAVHPTEPDTVWIGTDGGLFRTRDGGATWRRLAGGLPSGRTKIDDDVHLTVTAISLDPRDARRLVIGVYATGLGETAGVWRSDDGGDTWSDSSVGLIREVAESSGIPVRGDWVFSLDRSPHRPESLAVVTARGGFASEDAGLTWTSLEGVAGGHVAFVPWGRGELLWADREGEVRRRGPDGDWLPLASGLPTGTVDAEGEEREIAITLTAPDGTVRQVTGRRFSQDHVVRSLAFDAATRTVYACSTTDLFALPLP